MNEETPDTRGRDAAIDLAATCGVSFIGIGSWQIYEPAGYIVVGIILLAGAIMASRGS